MKKIKEVRVEIVEEDEEEGYSTTDLSAPTIDMAIEKMGAFERSRDRYVDPFDAEKEAEDHAREDIKDIQEEIKQRSQEEMGDIIKPQEAEADGLIKIKE